MICETKADSDTCDQIIDDMLEWAINSLKLPIIVNPRLARAYFSQLEVQTEVDLGMALPMFHPIGQSISDCLKSYGHEFAPYVVASLKMHVDPTLTAALAPIEFTFERRGGQPYMLSVYHSAAALRTADHIKILNRLEQVLAANQATHLL